MTGTGAVDKSIIAPLRQEWVLSPLESAKTIQRIRFRDEAKPACMRRNRDNKSNSKDSRIDAKFHHTQREHVDAIKFNKSDRRLLFHRLNTDAKTS